MLPISGGNVELYGAVGFLSGFQQGVEAIVVHGFLCLRMNHRGAFIFDGSVSSTSASSTPHWGRGVAVLRIDVRPSNLSGIAFRSSIASTFAPGPTVCGSSESSSHPASTSEEDLQVRFMVEPILGSCAVCLNDVTAR